MADSHGQIWIQVQAASSQDTGLFQGRAAQVERRVADMLQLGSVPRFPIRRLITVWRNERWRAMTSRWCETAIGKATFQISTWDWMISYRIDDVCPPYLSGRRQPSPSSWQHRDWLANP